MRKLGKRTIVFATLTLVLLGSTVAYTYTLLQPARHWSSVPVQVCVKSPGHVSITSADPDGGITATRQALNNTHLNLAGTGWNVTSAGDVMETKAQPVRNIFLGFLKRSAFKVLSCFTSRGPDRSGWKASAIWK